MKSDLRKIIDRFKKPVKLAEEAGVTLALESCHHVNTGTGLLVGKLIDEFGSNKIRLLWDPINSFYASGEDPYPYEYERIKQYIVYIDIKDALIDKRLNLYQFCQLGEGNKVSWPKILRALIEDDYQGVIALEAVALPAVGTKEEVTREFYRRLRELLASLESG
jgi:sugar phosphate isomerase/epimerase